MPTDPKRADAPAQYPPKENLVRASWGSALETRASDGGPTTLFGHFAVFNRWTEINSQWEGNFMERIAPGAFARTFKNNRANMRVTLNHGQDPDLGDKPIAVITDLREDAEGGYYEADLLDGLPRLVVDGLAKGQYGASFRFNVMQEEFERKVKPSEDNPEGLPERTIKEVRVAEFGPVTFPAYAEATSGVRSLTDDFIVRQLVGDPDRLFQLLRHYIPSVTSAALPPGPEESLTPRQEPAKPVVPVQPRFKSQEEYLAWLTNSH